MKRIEVNKWEAKNKEGIIIKEDTQTIIGLILGIGLSEEKIKGFDNMRMAGRVSRALDKSDKEGYVLLENADYNFIKRFIEKYAPAQWGSNEKIIEAVEAIMNAEDYEVK